MRVREADRQTDRQHKEEGTELLPPVRSPTICFREAAGQEEGTRAARHQTNMFAYVLRIYLHLVFFTNVFVCSVAAAAAVCALPKIYSRIVFLGIKFPAYRGSERHECDRAEECEDRVYRTEQSYHPCLDSKVDKR